MKHNWSIICLKSIIDVETNHISLIDALEQFNLPQTAFGKDLDVSYHLISYFTEIGARDRNIKQKIRIIDPQGNELKSLEFNTEVPEQYNRIRLRHIIRGIPLTTPGMYKFIISIDKDNKYIDVAEVGIEAKLKN